MSSDPATPAPAPLVEVLRRTLIDDWDEYPDGYTLDDLSDLATRLAEAVQGYVDFGPPPTKEEISHAQAIVDLEAANLSCDAAERERDAARRELAKMKSTPEYEYVNTVADERDAARLALSEAVNLLRETQEVGHSEGVRAFLARLEGSDGVQ